MKYTKVSLVLIFVISLLVSCSSNENSTSDDVNAETYIISQMEKELQGIWEVQNDNKDITIHYLFRDGSVACAATYMGITPEPREGTYEITDSEILLHYDSGVEASLPYTYTGDTLTIIGTDDNVLIKVE